MQELKINTINSNMYGFRNFVINSSIEEQIINLYLDNPKMKISEISQQTGKSEGEIYRVLHANYVSPNRLKINHEKVFNLSHLGWKINDIAELTGYTPRNIRYILNKNISEDFK